jgi:hypothetical protein
MPERATPKNGAPDFMYHSHNLRKVAARIDRQGFCDVSSDITSRILQVRKETKARSKSNLQEETKEASGD